MSKSTRATRILAAAGAAFTLHEYVYDTQAQHIGMQAADALGVPPERLMKTLMAVVDGKPVCAVVPSNRELSMKRLAAAVGGKAARMMPLADAERASGYVAGGISPFGQRRRMPILLEREATTHESVFVNGGQRGLQIALDPETIVQVLHAATADLVQ